MTQQDEELSDAEREEIRRQTPEQMADRWLALPTGRKVQLLAPLVRDRKGHHLDVFQAILADADHAALAARYQGFDGYG